MKIGERLTRLREHDDELAALRAQVAELSRRLDKLEAAPSSNRSLQLVRGDAPYEPGALIG